MQRIGLNKGGYSGERIDIVAILSEIDQFASATGWTSEVFLDWPAPPSDAPPSLNVRPGPFKLRAYSRLSVRSAERDGGHDLRRDGLEGRATRARRVYISAGIHGDEPAGPLAVCELLRQNTWPTQLEFCVVPCINPTGFQRGTRENYQNADLNRDYRQGVTEEVKAHIRWLSAEATFDLALLLHEDWESNGFYVYELNPNNQPSLAEAMIEATRLVCPIETATRVDEWDCKNGIISPKVNPEDRPQWAEAIYLLKTRSRQNYTIESPSDFPMPTRIGALCAAVNAALKAFGNIAPKA